MNYSDQRKLALKILKDIDCKDLKEAIKDPDNCFEDILKIANNYREEILKTIDQWPSQWAYYWAYNIGDKDLMRPLITESHWAYYWALDIGDKDLMRPLITESEWAYYWAYNIGDKDLMRPLITESHWAYMWAIAIGDKDLMRPLITESRWLMSPLTIGNERNQQAEDHVEKNTTTFRVLKDRETGLTTGNYWY